MSEINFQQLWEWGIPIYHKIGQVCDRTGVCMSGELSGGEIMLSLPGSNIWAPAKDVDLCGGEGLFRIKDEWYQIGKFLSLDSDVAHFQVHKIAPPEKPKKPFCFRIQRECSQPQKQCDYCPEGVTVAGKDSVQELIEAMEKFKCKDCPTTWCQKKGDCFFDNTEIGEALDAVKKEREAKR